MTRPEKNKNSEKRNPKHQKGSFGQELLGTMSRLENIIAAAPDCYLILTPDFLIETVTDAYLAATFSKLQQIEFSEISLPSPNLVNTKEKTEALIKDAIRETRHVSHELVPLLLEEFGLDTAPQDFCKRFSHTSIQLYCQGLTQRLEKYLELAVYRIAQELMNNIAKHAGATRARVEMFLEKEQLIIEAQDNGKGIDYNAMHRKGIGLKTIQNRVKLLGGTMEINSTSGKGTLITISLPLTLSSEKDSHK